MKQKRYFPTIPSRRFYTNLIFMLKNKNFKKTLVTNIRQNSNFTSVFGHKTVASVHNKKKRPFIISLTNIIKNHYYYGETYVYNKLINKEFLVFKSVYQWVTVCPSLKSSFPGFKFILKPEITNLIRSHNFSNTLLYLKFIPYNFFICYVQNFIKNKFTFILSNGCSGSRLKAKKKYKLLLISLPSKKKLYISKNTLVFLGQLDNNIKQAFTFGKCGSNIKKKIKLCVRGVAKNPVDHPNGGRTKSKSPERSP